MGITIDDIRKRHKENHIIPYSSSCDICILLYEIDKKKSKQTKEKLGIDFSWYESDKHYKIGE